MIYNKKTNHKIHFNKFFLLLIVLAFIELITFTIQAKAEKKLIPRLPEIIIEKGYSEYFTVDECIIKAKVEDEVVKSKVFVTLSNSSQNPIASTIKIRALYLLSDESLKLKISGKNQNFSRKNNRYNISISPNEKIKIEIDAIQSILYNLEDQENSIKSKDSNIIFDRNATNNKNSNKGSKFNNILQEFSKYFGRENYTKALAIGTIVSKWGVFPVTFKNISIEINVPNEFEAIINSNSNDWHVQKTARSNIFTFNRNESYSETYKEAIFILSKDAKKFRDLQKAISNKFGILNNQ